MRGSGGEPVGLLGAWVLRSVGASALAPELEPRLSNLATGLARDLGTDPPGLFLIPSGGPNALVVRSSGSALAITTSMLELYTRTELEAVVAHCLVRLLDPRRLRKAALAAAVGLPARSPRGPSARLPGEPGAGPVGLEDDLAAVWTTRYPPALAAAISKASPASGRFAPLWFVSSGPSQLPPNRRIAEVSDL